MFGSFDPITNRTDVCRPAKLFDELYIGLFYSQNKAELDIETHRILEEGCSRFTNVKVITAR